MDPLSIESETMSSNNLVSEQRKRSSHDDVADLASAKVSTLLKPLQVEEHLRRLDGLLHVETKVCFLRKSTFSAAKYVSQSLAKTVVIHSALGKTHNYEIVSDWDAYPNRGVFAESSAKQQIMDFTRRCWLHFDLALAVEYAKTFNFFHKLNATDQIIILRGSCLQSFLVTQAFESLQRKSDQLEQPDGKMLIKSLRERGSPMADALEQLSMGPILRIRPSKEEYVLLKAIMLSNAACSDLSGKGREVVATEQNAYAQTLLKVCTREHGSNVGALRFTTIIAAVDGFLRLAQRHKDWYIVFKAMRHCGKTLTWFPMETPLVDELME